jgi:hypothetical protein
VQVTVLRAFRIQKGGASWVFVIQGETDGEVMPENQQFAGLIDTQAQRTLPLEAVSRVLNSLALWDCEGGVM